MRRTLALILLLAATLAVDADPGAAQRAPQRVRFTVPAGESLLVHGEYPTTQSSCVDPFQPLLHARYRGTVEVLRASDGSLSLIGELSFDDYVKGIAEVPRDWPMEALKAQVVAARTYALNRMRAGSGSGQYDLCATTACQVYVGMQVEAGPRGERWVRAVEETAGQVLLHDGAPAITYYSSTSPGRTFDVEDVFGGTALPYLRGGPERDDRASPVSRWRVEMPFDDLARFLAADGVWGGGPIRGVQVSSGSIRIQGRQSVTLSKAELRSSLNDTASCLAPDRYPTPRDDGTPLPQTVPSRWYRAGQSGRAIVLEGRGWGHGVGMVQWGAFGKAKRGLPYPEILGAYYGGLAPQAVSLPDRIRILIAEGLTRLTVAPTGDVEMTPRARGGAPWAVTGGGGVTVRSGSPPPAVLEASGLDLPHRLPIAEPVVGSITLSDEATVRLELVRGDRRHQTPAVPFDDGEVRLELPPLDVPTGRYEVRALANDGVDEVATEPRTVRVVAQPAAVAPTEPPTPEPTRSPLAAPPTEPAGSTTPLVLGGVVLLVVLLAAGLTLRRRRGSHAP
jgi:SpoIID/LytB domain protein